MKNCLKLKIISYVCLMPIFLVMFLFLAQPILADNFDISVTTGTQSFTGSDIPLYVSIDPKATEANVKVQWIIPGEFRTTPGEATSFTTPMIEGDILYDHIVVQPLYSGVYPVTVNVSGILSNGEAFSESDTLNLNIGSGLALENNRGEFTIKELIYLLIEAFAIFIYLMAFRSIYYYCRLVFLNWLNKDS